MPSRHIGLEGPVNFRDLGGYRAGEHSVRWGRLYRSDSLHTLTAADLPVLEELGIRTVIDFRSGDELEELGLGPLGELTVRHVHCPTFDRLRDASLLMAGTDAPGLYARMLEHGASAYVRALSAVAEASALPAAFFCQAGKDRTGCFAALVLGILGVADTDIVADYVLTEAVMPAITARRVARYGAETVSRQWRNLPTALRGAKAEVMEGLLTAVAARWGDWAGYARAVGIETGLVALLRAELLEPATPLY